MAYRPDIKSDFALLHPSMKFLARHVGVSINHFAIKAKKKERKRRLMSPSLSFSLRSLARRAARSFADALSFLFQRYGVSLQGERLRSESSSQS